MCPTWHLFTGCCCCCYCPPPLQVALEFHKMRDRYPEFFQSQIGNKIMYGGVSKQARVRG